MIFDYLGKEIKVGSKVVYPGRSGSHLWMNDGEVVELTTHEEYWSSEPLPAIKVKRLDWNKNEKIVTVYCLNRVVVIGE